MLTMVLGILAMAMPITVLGSNFQTQFDEQNRQEYVNACDIFRTLEIGLEYQRRNIPPENAVAVALSENELEKLKKVKEDLPDSCGVTLSVHEVMQKDISRLEKNVDEMNGKLERVLQQLACLTGEVGPSSPAARTSSTSSREGDLSSAVAAAGGEKSAPPSPAAPPVAAKAPPPAAPETSRVPLEDWLNADQSPTKVLI